MATQDHTNPPVTADSLNTESLVNFLIPLVEMGLEQAAFDHTNADSALVGQERVISLLTAMNSILAEFAGVEAAQPTALPCLAESCRT